MRLREPFLERDLGETANASLNFLIPYPRLLTLNVNMGSFTCPPEKMTANVKATGSASNTIWSGLDFRIFAMTSGDLGAFAG